MPLLISPTPTRNTSYIFHFPYPFVQSRQKLKLFTPCLLYRTRLTACPSHPDPPAINCRLSTHLCHPSRVVTQIPRLRPPRRLLHRAPQTVGSADATLSSLPMRPYRSALRLRPALSTKKLPSTASRPDDGIPSPDSFAASVGKNAPEDAQRGPKNSNRSERSAIGLRCDRFQLPAIGSTIIRESHTSQSNITLLERAVMSPRSRNVFLL